VVGRGVMGGGENEKGGEGDVKLKGARLAYVGDWDTASNLRQPTRGLGPR